MKKIVALLLVMFMFVGCSSKSQGVVYNPKPINFSNANLMEYGYDFNIYLNSITIKNGVITINSTIENSFSTPIDTDNITFRIFNEYGTLKKEIIQPNEKKDFTVNIKFPLKNQTTTLSIKYDDPANDWNQEIDRYITVP